MKSGFRGLFLAAMLVAGATPSHALDKVRVGKSGGPMILSLVEVGTEAGIWRERGLDVEGILFGGEAPTMQGLASGSTEFGFGSGPGLAFPVKGVPATAIAAVTGAPWNLVVNVGVGSKLTSLDDLRGKTLGVTSSGSLTDWMAHEIGRSRGWGADGVKTFPSGSARTSLAALKTGDIDGVVMGAATAWDSQLHGGSRVLASFGDMVPKFHSNVLYAGNAFIAAHPDVVQKFVDGWFATVAFARNNPEVVIRIGAKTLGIEEASARAAYDAEITKMLRDNGRFDPEAVETIRRSLVDMGALETVPPAEKLYDERFVRAK